MLLTIGGFEVLLLHQYDYQWIPSFLRNWMLFIGGGRRKDFIFIFSMDAHAVIWPHVYLGGGGDRSRVMVCLLKIKTLLCFLWLSSFAITQLIQAMHSFVRLIILGIFAFSVLRYGSNVLAGLVKLLFYLFMMVSERFLYFCGILHGCV